MALARTPVRGKRAEEEGSECDQDEGDLCTSARVKVVVALVMQPTAEYL